MTKPKAHYFNVGGAARFSLILPQTRRRWQPQSTMGRVCTPSLELSS